MQFRLKGGGDDLKVDRMVLGAAGELRVMSELMLRGFNPAKTYLDNGVDLILENGKTIQVKTSNKGTQKRTKNPTWNSYDLYHFVFQDWKNKSHMKADFAICWCMSDNIFLVIPKDKIISGQVTYKPGAEKSSFSQYLNNWDILK